MQNIEPPKGGFFMHFPQAGRSCLMSFCLIAQCAEPMTGAISGHFTKMSEVKEQADQTTEDQ